MDLKKATTAQLEEELKRRNLKTKQELARPKPVDKPNLEDLMIACESYIEDLDNGFRTDENIQSYIFAEAMEAIYGIGIFDWVYIKRR
jgi:hypothetical protein